MLWASHRICISSSIKNKIIIFVRYYAYTETTTNSQSTSKSNKREPAKTSVTEWKWKWKRKRENDQRKYVIVVYCVSKLFVQRWRWRRQQRPSDSSAHCGGVKLNLRPICDCVIEDNFVNPLRKETPTGQKRISTNMRIEKRTSARLPMNIVLCYDPWHCARRCNAEWSCCCIVAQSASHIRN